MWTNLTFETSQRGSVRASPLTSTWTSMTKMYLEEAVIILYHFLPSYICTGRLVFQYLKIQYFPSFTLSKHPTYYCLLLSPHILAAAATLHSPEYLNQQHGHWVLWAPYSPDSGRSRCPWMLTELEDSLELGYSVVDGEWSLSLQETHATELQW